MCFKGGVRNKQSGESPFQVQQDDECSGDPDSLGGMRVWGSVGLMKEKWSGVMGRKPARGTEEEGLSSSLRDVGVKAADEGATSR